VKEHRGDSALRDIQFEGVASIVSFAVGAAESSREISSPGL